MELSNIAISASSHLNSSLYRYLHSGGNLLTINEYPKSGATWLAKLIASVVELPYMDRIVGIPINPCVTRTHWVPHTKYSPSIYVIRDGRDVMTSFFYHRCKNIKLTPSLDKEFYARFGERISEEKIRSQMSKFIEMEQGGRKYRYGVGCNWSEYVEQAKSIAEKVDRAIIVRYEDLLEDPVTVVQSIVSSLYGVSVPAERVSLAVQFHDKKWSSVSSLNLQKQTTFVRKGISGDWKNVFDKKAIEVFVEYGGDGLIAMGYEESNAWASEIAASYSK